MIKTQREYQEALQRIEQDKRLAELQQSKLIETGLTVVEVERAMEPLLSFQEQLVDEVRWYERIRRGDFTQLNNLSHLGRLLIALRIANGLSQRELAQRLGVHESQVSRDERNEYYGVTLERAQRVVEGMGETIVTQVKEKDRIVEEPILMITR